MQYRFDKFVLDSEQLYLTINGEPADADARQLQLVSVLIESYPNCCEHDYLRDKLWPSTVVSQWSLGRLVSDTRKLFRECGFEGPVIQTLHGRGYRLSPELAERLDATPAVEAAPEREELLPAGDIPAEPVLPHRSVPAGSGNAVDNGTAAAHSALHRRLHWRLLLGMGLLILAAVMVVYLTTARRIPDESVPLVIAEGPDARGRILWVDDNPDNNLVERSHFESQRIAIYLATNTEDALTLLSMYRYDAVISDMGRDNEPLAGIKLMERMRAQRDHTPYFLYTIMSSESQRELVSERGGNGVAVTSAELYRLLLPLFDHPEK